MAVVFRLSGLLRLDIRKCLIELVFSFQQQEAVWWLGDASPSRVSNRLGKVFSWLNSRMRRRQCVSLFLHGLGLSSFGAALFLQVTVFNGIVERGYFRGVEQNPIALWAEVGLTVFGIVYFSYLSIRLVLSVSNSPA